jgi:hypothetical protein
MLVLGINQLLATLRFTRTVKVIYISLLLQLPNKLWTTLIFHHNFITIETNSLHCSLLKHSKRNHAFLLKRMNFHDLAS